MVSWFNAVDATHRADLREFNDLNFARFDATLGERLAEMDAKWTSCHAELRTEVRGELRDLRVALIKWMFLFWTGTTLTVLGAVFTLTRA